MRAARQTIYERLVPLAYPVMYDLGGSDLLGNARDSYCYGGIFKVNKYLFHEHCRSRGACERHRRRRPDQRRPQLDRRQAVQQHAARQGRPHQAGVLLVPQRIPLLPVGADAQVGCRCQRQLEWARLAPRGGERVRPGSGLRDLLRRSARSAQQLGLGANAEHRATASTSASRPRGRHPRRGPGPHSRRDRRGKLFGRRRR